MGTPKHYLSRTLEFAETLPMKFFLFKEGLYVIAADPKYRDLLGSQVLNFGDASVNQAMAALAPVVFRDNDIWLKTMGPIFFVTQLFCCLLYTSRCV